MVDARLLMAEVQANCMGATEVEEHPRYRWAKGLSGAAAVYFCHYLEANGCFGWQEPHHDEASNSWSVLFWLKSDGAPECAQST